MEKQILVIYTGGTIGMIKDTDSGVLKPFNFKNIYEQLPMLRQFNYKIDFLTFENLIDSSDADKAFWIELATKIEDNYDKYDGFVVLHGSDTMSYTASALSFMFKNLNKPVVLTGSQLSLAEIRSDGRDNIINAIEVAAAYKGDIPMVPEVSICFENKILRGNRTLKNNAENFEAFISPNYPPLAEVGVNIKYNREFIHYNNKGNFSVNKNIDERIAVIKLFPGISSKIIEAVLEVDGIQAVILETYGSGNAPTTREFLEVLKSGIEKGIIIVNVTQCTKGSVQMGKYETGKQLEEIGIIGAWDMTTESAVTKLMCLLGQLDNKDDVRTIFPQTLRGEITLE